MGFLPVFLLLVLSAPRAAAAYRETVSPGGGVVAGVVRYAGTIQGTPMIPATRDVRLFGNKLPDESLLVSRDHGLQNVLITLDGISAGKAWPHVVPRLLYQQGRLIPRLQVARRGQEIEVLNQDRTLHTVSLSEVGQSLFNIALPQQYPVTRIPLSSAGIFNIRCVIHEWMAAWIAVLSHPYFAITAADGRYEISDVPPGTYRLSAWHERLGRLVRWVSVTGEPALHVDLEFGELPVTPSATKKEGTP